MQGRDGARLSPREMLAAQHLARGANRHDLAQHMHVSLSTADKFIRALKDKLGVKGSGELIVTCAQLLGARQAPADSGLTEGIAKVEAGPQQPPPGALGAERFAQAATFPELFSALEATLAPMGVTAISYSHARIHPGQRVEHLGTRWNFPDGVQYDPAIPLEENFAVRHAFRSWEPFPLDLEALMASDIHPFLSEGIQRQNAIFRAAGLTRGIIYVLPGLGARDRLVCSVIFGGLGQGAFPEHVTKVMAGIYVALLNFRAAHIEISLAQQLPHPPSFELLNLLAEDVPLDEACARLDLGRRTGERLLADAKQASGVRNTAALIARHVTYRLSPTLVF